MYELYLTLPFMSKHQICSVKHYNITPNEHNRYHITTFE